MKVLVLHPSDKPLNGRWVELAWDQIVDLGSSSTFTRQFWEKHCGCPVVSISRPGTIDLRQIRRWAASAHGLMMDDWGLDWWELLIPVYATALEELRVLRRVAWKLRSNNVEVFITRPGWIRSVLQALLGRPVNVADSGIAGIKTRFRTLAAFADRLELSAVQQQLYDRFDPGFVLRGALTRTAEPNSRSFVLLPSAYSNVSRAASTYARMLPGHDFLLVTTRANARIPDLPRNVRLANLAEYAQRSSTSDESRHLLDKWTQIEQRLSVVPEFRLCLNSGIFSSVPWWIRTGLSIRNAWLNLFARESVQAVLCGDDSNPFTRIPSLLSSHKETPTVCFHHGALDFRAAVKTYHDEVYLAKSRMEHDYLVNRCGLSSDIVQVGAPEIRRVPPASAERAHDLILFFSEPFEAMSARAEESYADVLPKLVELARKYDKTVVVKLHPFESMRQRRRIIAQVLSSAERSQVKIIAHTLNQALLHNAWFGLTFSSSVVLECAREQVPCFIASWMDLSGYYYAEQYLRFGAGLPLNSPADIWSIPKHIERYSSFGKRNADIWQPLTAARLARLLGDRHKCAAIPVRPEDRTNCAIPCAVGQD